MNLCFVYDSQTQEQGAGEWRGFRFAKAIQRTDRHPVSLLDFNAFSRNTASSQSLCGAASLIVVQGRALVNNPGVIQRWKARDKAVVVDLDVPERLLERRNQAPLFPQVTAGPSQQPIDWALRLVDAALLPSRQMLDEFSHYTYTCWVPDYIDLDRYLTVNPAPHEGIVLGLQLDCANLQGLLDCGLIDGLKCVCQARPELQLLAWNAAHQRADLSLLGDPAWINPYPFDDWIWPHPLTYVDIGLAPLTGTSDLWRGWGDILEYMVMKIPWLASDGPAYYDLRSYGWRVHNHPGSWERVLLDMVDHLSAYKTEAAGEAYLYGISQGIDENVENLLAVFSNIYRNAFLPEVSTYVAR